MYLVAPGDTRHLNWNNVQIYLKLGMLVTFTKPPNVEGLSSSNGMILVNEVVG